MKQLLFFTAGVCFLLAGCNHHTMEKESIIKTYFAGWEKKDWSLIEKQLSPGFTFTSPNDDDHLPLQKFKD